MPPDLKGCCEPETLRLVKHYNASLAWGEYRIMMFYYYLFWDLVLDESHNKHFFFCHSCLRTLLKPRTTFADVQTFQTFSLFLSLEDRPGFLQVFHALFEQENMTPGGGGRTCIAIYNLLVCFGLCSGKTITFKNRGMPAGWACGRYDVTHLQRQDLCVPYSCSFSKV